MHTYTLSGAPPNYQLIRTRIVLMSGSIFNHKLKVGIYMQTKLITLQKRTNLSTYELFCLRYATNFNIQYTKEINNLRKNKLFIVFQANLNRIKPSAMTAALLTSLSTSLTWEQRNGVRVYDKSPNRKIWYYKFSVICDYVQNHYSYCIAHN